MVRIAHPAKSHSKLTKLHSFIHIHQFTHVTSWPAEKAKLGHAIFTQPETP